MTDYLSTVPGGADDDLRARFGRAPVWAQHEMNRLARDFILADAQRRLADGPEDTDTWADPYSNPPRPLGSPRIIRHHYAKDVAATITFPDPPSLDEAIAPEGAIPTGFNVMQAD